MHAMDRIRPYEDRDADACLALFDGNVPMYFARGERADFVRFLARQAGVGTYLVVERGGVVVACGGHTLEEDATTAGFCWGMVERRLHRQGLGRLLTRARLDACRQAGTIARVRLDTSQHTRAFYARFGFRVERITPDGYGPGLDRCDMVLALDAPDAHAPG